MLTWRWIVGVVTVRGKCCQSISHLGIARLSGLALFTIVPCFATAGRG